MSVPPELSALRASIDNLDAALVHLLAERFRCTQRVGHLKHELGLPAADPVREEQQLARLRVLASDAGLDPVFAEKVLGFIIAEVIRNHGIIAEGAAVGSADEA
ncbi:MAG TPA: chorismate mutase [Dermatophilaceae bacterium]|nr:chorismate mutase [Dermatophilaceae bacterium]